MELKTTESGAKEDPKQSKETSEQWEKRETDWVAVLAYLHLHFFAAYSLVFVVKEAKLITILWGALVGALSLMGATAGAHRLWAHRSYSASTAFRLFLALCFTATGQGSIYNWVLDHRMHHKYHGTDNDPYNYNRGFYFSQIFVHTLKPLEKHKKLSAEIDMSDLEADSIVMYQKKFCWILVPIVAFLLPINAPAEYWGDSIFNSVCIVGILRYTIVLHLVWLINSAELIWGIANNDKYSSDSNLVFFVTKSHWPAYHYMLPWDYQTGEYGGYGCGCTTAMIRVGAALGGTWGLRTVGTSAVRAALTATVRSGEDLLQKLEEEGNRAAEKEIFIK